MKQWNSTLERRTPLRSKTPLRSGAPPGDKQKARTKGTLRQESNPKAQDRKTRKSKSDSPSNQLKLTDNAWSKLVHAINGGCADCPSTYWLEAHHIVPRGFWPTRFDPANGMILCRKCHAGITDMPTPEYEEYLTLRHPEAFKYYARHYDEQTRWIAQDKPNVEELKSTRKSLRAKRRGAKA